MLKPLIVTFAVVAFGFAAEALCQDRALDEAPSQQSLIEAAAAFYGITISVIAVDWDDIPFVPLPAEYKAELESFPEIPFTLRGTRQPSNHAMERTSDRCVLHF
jgi:hypothetical protein